MTKLALEGLVAQILNDQELVINIGSETGVEKGMKFAVLAVTPLIVVDPLTNETLDELDQEKVRVEAVDVRSRISTCRTFEYKTIGGGLSGLSEMFGPRQRVPKTFRATEYPEPLPEEDSYVKIGDRVRELGKPVLDESKDPKRVVRIEEAGILPSETELDQLAEIHAKFAEHGIRPGPKGYDEQALVGAISERGWRVTLQGEDSRWEAQITVVVGPTRTEDFIASDYWDRESALAFALAMAVASDDILPAK